MNTNNRLCPGDGNREIKRRCLAIVSLFSKILNKLITSAPKEVVRLRWESRDRSSAVFREHKTSGRIQLSHTCAEDSKLMPICNWKCSCHYLQQPASPRERSKEWTPADEHLWGHLAWAEEQRNVLRTPLTYGKHTVSSARGRIQGSVCYNHIQQDACESGSICKVAFVKFKWCFIMNWHLDAGTASQTACLYISYHMHFCTHWIKNYGRSIHNVKQ